MLTAQDLIEMRKMVAASTVIQSGAFKEELDKIAAASAELDGKMAVVKTLEAVDARRAEIVAELEKREIAVADREKLADDRHIALGQLETSLKDQAALLVAQDTDLASRETSVRQEENRVKAMSESSAAATMKRTAEMDERQQRLVDRENALKKQEKVLADKLVKLNTVLGA